MSYLRNAVAVVAVVSALLLAHVHAKGSSLRIQRRPHQYVANEDMSAAERAASDPRHVIKLTGGVLTLGAYFATVSIGTPATEFTVLIDTGSSNLAVAGADCAESACGAAQHGVATYDAAGSSTAQPVPCASKFCQTCNLHGNPSECLFATPFCWPADTSQCGYSISYGGSSSFIRGPLVTDVVTFGGFTTNATFVAMAEQQPAQRLAQAGLGGILGLAHEWNAINPTYVPTLFKTLVDEKQVEDLFGLCLSPSAGGTLDLGFVDSTKYTGSLQYINITKQRWYNMPLVDITFNGTSIGLPPTVYDFQNDAVGTFIDSGTSVMLFSPVIYSAIQTLWQSKFCNLPYVCDASKNIFTGVCVSKDQVSLFPDFEYHFTGADGSDVVLNTPATSYLVENGGSYCWGAASYSGVNAVLGDVFMENFYIVHDRANQRLGFAPVSNCVSN